MFTLTALLFAGGESRRMGADKATLDWNGEPIWSRQLRTLRELHADELWISAKARPSWCPAEMEVVLDEPPSRGPLSGLTAAFKQLRTTHLLALAVDMPQMTVEHLKKLQHELRPGSGSIPRSAAGYEPLCAFYPAEAADLAKVTATSNEASLQTLASRLVECRLAEVYTIPPSKLRLYSNMNTPSDYDKAFCERL